MAQLNPTENVRQKRGRSRIKKSALAIDMTPMVDLGFLLICFFVFTTSMNEPKVTDLYMPADGPPTFNKRSASLTVLIGNNDNIYCYDGMWNEAIHSNNIVQTNYSVANGLGAVIRAKQQFMNRVLQSDSGRNDLMLIIKATKDASYKHLMDVLDEVLINDVRRYAIVDPTTEEMSYLEK